MSIICILLAFLIGLLIGYHEAQIQKGIVLLKDKITEERPSPTVVSTRPETTGRVESGAVILPKTPQEIDFQEAEAIRRMNPGS